jgi:hypothetical protein
MSLSFDPLNILKHFQIPGDFQQTHAYGEGHINDTYLVIFQESDDSVRRYILQRINLEVFKRPEYVMFNIAQVTEYIHKKVLADSKISTRKTITFVPTLENRTYYVSPLGEYWRLSQFIEGAHSYQGAIGFKHCYSAAKAFGEFLTLLWDFPAAKLYETISNSIIP